MKILLSPNIKSLNESVTLKLIDETKQLIRRGIDVISLSAGEPDFDTPRIIKKYAIRAINNGFTKYTPTAGIAELKTAIIRKFKHDNRLTYRPNEVVVSNGAKHSIFNAIYALCGKGDEVLIPVPYWVSYPDQVKACGGRPVFVQPQRNHLQMDLDDLARRVTRKTKLLILNSPNNPSGIVYDRKDLAAIARLAVKHGFFVLSDEIYEELIYPPARHTSIAALGRKIKELTIVVNGVSKAYAMTGWRIGYAAGPAPVIQAMTRLQGHVTSNPNSISQYAALAALTHASAACKAMVKSFALRRRYITKALQGMPLLKCHEPQGGFYVFPDVSRITAKSYRGEKIRSSLRLSELLLKEARIAVVPGEGFGFKNHIRISYANSLKNLTEAMKRLKLFLGKVK